MLLLVCRRSIRTTTRQHASTTRAERCVIGGSQQLAAELEYHHAFRFGTPVRTSPGRTAVGDGRKGTEPVAAGKPRMVAWLFDRPLAPPYAPLVPIFIVRWVNRSASIIRADDEDHLRLLLDEVGDPDAAIWEEYDGPLWIELEPKWRQIEPDKLELADDHFDAHTQPWDVLEPGVASGDTSAATYWTILARLFPHLYLALRDVDRDELSDDQAKTRIVEALEREQWLAAAYDERPRHQSTPEEMALWAAVLEGRLHVKRDLAAEREEIAALQREEIEWRAVQYMRLRAERQQALEDLESLWGNGGDDDDDDDDFDDDDCDVN